MEAGTTVKSHGLSQFKRISAMIFEIFMSLLADCTRLSGHDDGHIIVELTDVPASIHDRETAARRFDTIFKIIRPLRLAQGSLKVKKS